MRGANPHEHGAPLRWTQSPTPTLRCSAAVNISRQINPPAEGRPEYPRALVARQVTDPGTHTISFHDNAPLHSPCAREVMSE